MYILEKILDGSLDPNIPFVCDCNFLLKAGTSSSEMECTNIICPLTNAEKLSELFSILKMNTQIGPIKARKLMNKIDILHPIEIFKPSIIAKNTSIFQGEYKSVLEEISKVLKNGIFAEEFISCLFLDTIGETRANQLFLEFTTPSEIYDKYNNEDSLMKYISDKYGISKYTDSVKYSYIELMSYKNFIIENEKNFKFKDKNNNTNNIEPIKIAITGELRGIKDENGNYIKIKPRDRIKDVFMNRYGVLLTIGKYSSSDVRFLIMDENMESHNKYNDVIKLKDKGHKIDVISSSDFQDIIEYMIENEDNNIDKAFDYIKNKNTEGLLWS